MAKSLRQKQPAGLRSQQDQTPHVTSEKLGRNDPCPCGSGKKYKKCCIIDATPVTHACGHGCEH